MSSFYQHQKHLPLGVCERFFLNFYSTENDLFEVFQSFNIDKSPAFFEFQNFYVINEFGVYKIMCVASHQVCVTC